MITTVAKTRTSLYNGIHNLHHNLDLPFLITGHTKFAHGWCFDLIKKRFRKNRVNTLSETAGVVKDSTVTGQHPRAGWTGGWYGAGGKLWLATTPDSVLQAAATDQAVPALQVKQFSLNEVILI